jgi:hypothetical protein
MPSERMEEEEEGESGGGRTVCRTVVHGSEEDSGEAEERRGVETWQRDGDGER